MDVSKNRGTPKSSILIGFSIIFTIHFGGPPLFLETPIYRNRTYQSHGSYYGEPRRIPEVSAQRRVEINGEITASTGGADSVVPTDSPKDLLADPWNFPTFSHEISGSVSCKL